MTARAMARTASSPAVAMIRGRSPCGATRAAAVEPVSSRATRVRCCATVVVDGSLWKPCLRIYELIDLAIELADRAVLP